jgi:hypothetical protein
MPTVTPGSGVPSVVTVPVMLPVVCAIAGTAISSARVIARSAVLFQVSLIVKPPSVVRFAGRERVAKRSTSVKKLHIRTEDQFIQGLLI